MPKRLIAFIAAFALTFAFAGCSSEGTSAASSSASSSSSSASSAAASSSAASSSAAGSPSESASSNSSSTSSSLFVANDFPENEVTADVPIPHFSVGASSIDTSESYVRVSYDAVPEDEVAAYVEDVKAAGFTYDANESKSNSKYSYSAWNNEDILQATNIYLQYTSAGELDIKVTN